MSNKILYEANPSLIGGEFIEVTLLCFLGKLPITSQDFQNGVETLNKKLMDVGITSDRSLLEENPDFIYLWQWSSLRKFWHPTFYESNYGIRMDGRMISSNKDLEEKFIRAEFSRGFPTELNLSREFHPYCRLIDSITKYREEINNLKARLID